MNAIIRIIRLLTGYATVADVDHFFDKTRQQYVKVQKRAIKLQREEQDVINTAEKRKEAAERMQKGAEKRIAKLNDMLED